MADLGATWVIVGTLARPQPAAAEFVEAFAATHIRG
jgi:hypothetical protein